MNAMQAKVPIELGKNFGSIRITTSLGFSGRNDRGRNIPVGSTRGQKTDVAKRTPQLREVLTGAGLPIQ
jgi:hypothetical protein